MLIWYQPKFERNNDNILPSYSKFSSMSVIYQMYRMTVAWYNLQENECGNIKQYTVWNEGDILSFQCCEHCRCKYRVENFSGRWLFTSRLSFISSCNSTALRRLRVLDIKCYWEMCFQYRQIKGKQVEQSGCM